MAVERLQDLRTGPVLDIPKGGDDVRDAASQKGSREARGAFGGGDGPASGAAGSGSALLLERC